VDNWFSWLDNAVGSLAKRVLSALGIGWVSFNGITEFASQLKDQVMTAWGGLPAEILAIATMAGIGTAMGLVLSAVVYKAAMSSFSWLGRVI